MKLKYNHYEVDMLVSNKEEREHFEKYMPREEAMIEAFLDEIQPGDLVWDVGAHVGTYSVFAAMVPAEVHAFEPHPFNRSRLRENLANNGVNAHIHGYALSDEAGTMMLGHGEHTLQRPGVGLHTLGEGAEEVVVKTGNDFPQPDVVKIDVEGAEMNVLRGMDEKLDRVSALFVEVHMPTDYRSSIEDFGSSLEEFKQFFDEWHIEELGSWKDREKFFRLTR